MATKFAGQYVQSFLNVMKTQFGVEIMVFGGYLDNTENVNTFRLVVLYPICFSFITFILENKPLQFCLLIVS
jgi:hypothetical protein